MRTFGKAPGLFIDHLSPPGALISGSGIIYIHSFSVNTRAHTPTATDGGHVTTDTLLTGRNVRTNTKRFVYISERQYAYGFIVFIKRGYTDFQTKVILKADRNGAVKFFPTGRFFIELSRKQYLSARRQDGLLQATNNINFTA